MKWILCAIIIMLMFVSCGKLVTVDLNSGKQYSLIDSSIYFKVDINNKTITTFGITVNGRPGGAMTDVTTATNASGLYTNLSVLWYGSVFNANLEKATEQCDVELFLTKPGAVLGSYKHDSTINRRSYITDITAGNTKYFFDESSIILNVVSADSPYIRGTFFGNLLNGSPVNGSFNLAYTKH